MGASPQKRWFGVREDLPKKRSAALMAVSFLLPLSAWCIAAYGPFWDKAYEITVSATSPKLQVVQVAGEVLDAPTWQEFQDTIASDNAEVMAARDAGQPLESSSRTNKKVLRQLAPLAISEGWLAEGQETDDEAIRSVWQDLAAGTLPDTALSEDNRGIVTANVADLDAAAPEWPTDSLLKLLPQSQAQVDRPVYLIPPHTVFVSLWEGLTEPAPEAALDGSDGSDQKTLLSRYGESITTIFFGFLLGAALAVPLGVLAGTYDFFSKLCEPFVDFFRYMPAPAFGVVLMAIFGLELGPKVMLVFLGTFPHAVLMIAKTTRQLERPLLEAAQTLGANQRQLVTKVVVPGILPNLYNDLRILLGWAWTWLVIAELLGFKSGLTEIIDTRGRRFQFEYVYPAILLIGLTGFVTDQILANLGRAFFPWAHGSPGFLGRQFNRLVSLIRRTVGRLGRQQEPLIHSSEGTSPADDDAPAKPLATREPVPPTP